MLGELGEARAQVLCHARYDLLHLADFVRSDGEGVIGLQRLLTKFELLEYFGVLQRVS